ncbi:hypothetical protein A5700_12170 [Mycobacterium sp. E1214]|nr:hypothetical protein A5700_12170 [Mycobacterium sp. E1214]OBH28720.1 hypothetical protein A5693_21485 [Mycobacterium sp. E1319]
MLTPAASAGLLAIRPIASVATELPSATASLSWPTMSPVPASFSTAGAYTYNIPYWANKIDVILLGGGSGGNAGGAGFVNGSGGAAGTWATLTTLVRGTDIPISTTQITGTVGAGGTRGVYGGAAPGSGGATTATATGWAGLSAAGGVYANYGSAVGRAPSPTSQTYNGQTYAGGAAQNTGGAAGNAPGGAGAGGPGSAFSGSSGGAGAPGEAWFYAYQ